MSALRRIGVVGTVLLLPLAVRGAAPPRAGDVLADCWLIVAVPSRWTCRPTLLSTVPAPGTVLSVQEQECEMLARLRRAFGVMRTLPVALRGGGAETCIRDLRPLLDGEDNQPPTAMRLSLASLPRPQGVDTLLHLKVSLEWGTPADSSVPANRVICQRVFEAPAGTAAVVGDWPFGAKDIDRWMIWSPINEHPPGLVQRLYVLVKPRSLAKGAQADARPAAPVLYARKDRFGLNRLLTAAGHVGAEPVAVWRAEGLRWERCALETDKSGKAWVAVPREGPWGFTLTPVKGEAPLPGYPPQVSVVVDSRVPDLVLMAPQVRVGNGRKHVVFLWSSSDENLRDRPVSLYWADRRDGPWQPVALGAPARGEYGYPAEKLPRKFYVRGTAIDRAGNVAEAATSEPISYGEDLPAVSDVHLKRGD
jgi:hypothetical protein